ncbi:MAG: alpha/beta hydrolase fold protein [Chloroflexi bacterium]|jgi:pimeloyl-ACP methyl ester carboxylesterase|nr:alpha/beta hydrolase fold protein [Chloroflexota bacterium]
MPYATVRDLQMYYELHGPEDGPQLALLNGALGFIGQGGHWDYHVNAFSEAGYRVLIYEHRGHRRTNNPPAHFNGYDEFADDAIALFDCVGFTRPHIAGLSDGAITALSLGMRYSQRVGSLVVAAANYYQDEAILKFVNDFTPELLREHMTALVADLDSKMPGQWEELWNQTRLMFRTNPAYSLTQLGGITSPTLVLAGDRDFIISLDQTIDIYKAIPESELCILPATNHVITMERPELSTTIILDFLTRRGNN